MTTRKVKYSQPAPPGERFAPDAFASQIGKTVPLTLEGSPAERDCKVLGAEVSEDGTSVEMTFEVDADAFPPSVYAANSFSFADDTDVTD